MAQRQINIRLDEDEVTVLEAAAFLDGLNVAELVRRLLRNEVTALRQQTDIRELVRHRAERAAARQGVLTPLDAKGSARNGSDREPA